MAAFQYPPLDPLKREFRILRPLLQSRMDHGEATARTQDNDIIVYPDLTLEFELQVVSMDDSPHYTTLSYVWGEWQHLKPILVNGSTFLVTPNLYSAFQHLRFQDIAPAIWIDAICINQTDQDEKPSQLLLMGSIYSNASHVIVWLGPATDNSNFIADVLHEFANQVRQRFKVPTQQEYPLMEYMEFEEASDLFDFLDMVLKCATSGPISAVDFMRDFVVFVCSCGWWRRVWIVQEFVLSREVQFQIGSRRIQLEELSALLYITMALKTHSLLGKSLWNSQVLQLFGGQIGYDWIMELLALRELRQRKYCTRDNTLYELLCQVYCRPAWPDSQKHLLRATMEIDQVYGLVGLVTKDFEELGLSIQKGKSWQESYGDVAERLLIAGYTDVLAFCQTTERSQPSDVPSWAPLWHQPIHVPNAWWKGVQEGKKCVVGNSLFSAAPNTKIQATFSSHLNARSMRIKGVFVDQVLHAKSVYLRSHVKTISQRELTFTQLFQEIQSLCDLSNSLGNNTYSATSLREAVWRLPVWDHEPRTGDEGFIRASEASYQRYQACMPMFEAVGQLLDAGTQLSHMRQHPFFTGPDIPKDANLYLLTMETGNPMKPFITKKGYIGMGPASMDSTDTICILFGARVPHILRQRSNGGSGYTFIGEAFVYGIMDGEFLTDDRPSTTFEIF